MTGTPQPPYWAVIFSSRRSPGDSGYAAMADRMVELAARQPGFLGMDSARGQDGFGITVSYWESRAAIDAWRDQPEHRQAQRLGIEQWYDTFELRVAEVGLAKVFHRGDGVAPHHPPQGGVGEPGGGQQPLLGRQGEDPGGGQTQDQP